MDNQFKYTFNGNDYEVIIRLYNGVNDIYLKPEAWEDLFIEEDLFDWYSKGSIVIKTPYDSLERASEETKILTKTDEKQLIYKFRGDGRDTLFISIIPLGDVPQNSGINSNIVFKDQLWRIELETVIYDVEDLPHSNITNKAKKLYFREKVYQMMLEKNIEFTTANVGTNKDKQNIHKLNNEERSLKTGEALGELLKNDPDFEKFSKNVENEELWDKGSDENKILYTSPSNYRFIDDLNYIYKKHTSTEDNQYQPCILKFERAEEKESPKQFSLIPIKKYFEKAGVEEPGDYQIEHCFIDENSETHNTNEIIIKKSPISNVFSTEKDVKADDFSRIHNYQIVEYSGKDYSEYLGDRVVISVSDKEGQFNIESKEHISNKFKDFYKDAIKPYILNELEEDRLPTTNYIQKGYNIQNVYSSYQTIQSRFPEGKNKILQFYLFSNLGISFSLRGLTIRQPGRFFALSKQTQNDKEFDHLLEGQYFITNIIHYFTNEKRSYFTRVTGVKTHMFQNKTELPNEDDLWIIKG